MEQRAPFDDRDRRLAELEREVTILREVVRTQELLNTGGRDAARSLSLVAERAQRLTRGSGASVEIVDGGATVYRAVTGDLTHHQGLRIALEASLSGWCVETGEAANCEDTELDHRVDRTISRLIGARSMIVAPLVNAGAAEGTLKVISQRPREFTEVHLRTLRSLASILSTSLRGAGAWSGSHRPAPLDPLTALPNRAGLLDHLDQAIRAGDWAVRDLALLHLNVEDFARFSDRYGDHAGDELLVVLAKRLRRCVRPNDIVARLGGDDFVIAADIHLDEQVEGLIGRIRDSLRLPFAIDGLSIDVGTNIGFARPTSVDDALSLVARADADRHRRATEARSAGPEPTTPAPANAAPS
jgi:diguanylate cyclase (GGDEF)-like protein